MSIVLASRREATRLEIGEVEAEKAAGKGEIVAQEIESAEELIVVRDQGLAFAEADLADHVGPTRGDDRIAESVKHTEIDARAMREQLLVQRDGIGLLAEQMETERLHPVGREPQLRTGLRFLVDGLIMGRYGASHGQLEPEARGAAGAGVRDQSLEGSGTREILRLDDIEGPERERLGEREPARNIAMRLAVRCIEHGALGDGPAVAQRRVAEFGLCANENEGRRRREIVRRELVDEVRGEIGELMLELELDPGGQERGALEKSGDHRIGGVADEASEPLGDARIVLREFGRLLAQDRKLLVIEPQEFAVHRSEPVELDLTGVELDLSDELHQDLDRLRLKRRADEKSHPELVRRHRVVPPGLDRSRHKPRLEVSKRRFDLPRNSADFVLVDRSASERRKPEVDDRFLDLGRARQVFYRIEIGRIEQRDELGVDRLPEFGLGNWGSRHQSPGGDDALALMTDIDFDFRVAILVGGAKSVHERRRQTIIFLSWRRHVTPH